MVDCGAISNVRHCFWWQATARDRNEAKARQRREAAREEKANNAVASQALNDEINKNRAARQKSYARRYVPTKAVEQLEAALPDSGAGTNRNSDLTSR